MAYETRTPGGPRTTVQDHLQLNVQHDPRAVVLSIGGELDLASSPLLDQELTRVTATEPELLVLDLRELAFMDSTGLSVLVRAHHHAEEAGRRMVLVRGGPQVQRLLTLTGLADRLPIVDSVGESYRDGR